MPVATRLNKNNLRSIGGFDDVFFCTHKVGDVLYPGTEKSELEGSMSDNKHACDRLQHIELLKAATCGHSQAQRVGGHLIMRPFYFERSLIAFEPG